MWFIKFLKRYERKIKITFLLVIVSVFIFHSILILSSGDEGLITYKSAIEQNKLEIKGLKVNYLIDNSSYIEVQSEIAYADKIDYAIEMDNVNIFFKDKSDNTTIIATADSGSYLLDRKLRAIGNVSGFINDLRFISEKDGYIEYDYNNEIGAIGNGITVEQDLNDIKANKVFFNTKTEYILFENKVDVKYVTR